MGLNCPLGLHQRVIRNSHITYNRAIHLYFLDAKLQLQGLCCSRFYLEKTTTFFCSGPNSAHFGRFESNNFSKQCQIELKFWPQIVLIVVQMPFKGFWKDRIFTENFYSTQSLSFWFYFSPNLPFEDDQNQKLALGCPNKLKSRPCLLSIINENHNNFLL